MFFLLPVDRKRNDNACKLRPGLHVIELVKKSRNIGSAVKAAYIYITSLLSFKTFYNKTDVSDFNYTDFTFKVYE